jgi:purine-binding chemotaxis protein CheW
MATELENGHSTAIAEQLAGRYLTFILDGETYAIPVLKVREIIRLTDIRPVPAMPEHVRGVINLRGTVIPVLDLRLRLGLAAAASTDQSCIVVTRVNIPGGRTTGMGLIVDSMEEVAQICAGDIEEVPEFGAQVSSHYLLGLAKLKGVVMALLDIERAVGGEEEVALAPAIEGASPIPTI